MRLRYLLDKLDTATYVTICENSSNYKYNNIYTCIPKYQIEDETILDRKILYMYPEMYHFTQREHELTLRIVLEGEL